MSTFPWLLLYNVVKVLCGIESAHSCLSMPLEVVGTQCTQCCNSVCSLQTHPPQGAAPTGGITFYNPAQFAQVRI